MGIDTADANYIQTLQILILLVAGIHLHPAVGSAIDCPTGGVIVDGGFHPDMLKLHIADDAAGCSRAGRDAAGGGEVCGGVDITEVSRPVAEAGLRHFDGAMNVSGRDAGGPQQGNGQAGGIHGVAASGGQGKF